MTKRSFDLPISEGLVRSLRVGDAIWLTGTIFTGRDDVHRRVAIEGMEFPGDLHGGAIFHAGPIVREEQGRYEMISIGPTSSIRMEDEAAAFLRSTGARIMIGKGGMGEKTAAACAEHGAVHCIFPGGCAVLGASMVERIDGVFWRELGMPECVWVLRVKEFGPLIVAIDPSGANMFADTAAAARARSSDAASAVIMALE